MCLSQAFMATNVNTLVTAGKFARQMIDEANDAIMCKKRAETQPRRLYVRLYIYIWKPHHVLSLLVEIRRDSWPWLQEAAPDPECANANWWLWGRVAVVCYYYCGVYNISQCYVAGGRRQSTSCSFICCNPWNWWWHRRRWGRVAVVCYYYCGV